MNRFTRSTICCCAVLALAACGHAHLIPNQPPAQLSGNNANDSSIPPQIDSTTFDSSALAVRAASPGVPKHVLTAGFVWGYAGTPKSVPLSSIAPYVSWAETDEASAARLRAAGIKVFIYTNFWINSHKDSPNIGYIDLRPGGAHAAAEARDCSGHILQVARYADGYEADARKAAALGHAQVVVNYRINEYHGQYDALFPDDTASTPDPPCGFSENSYIAATNKVDAALRLPTLINALGVGDAALRVSLTEPGNILGAMCEGSGCYAGWRSINGRKVDEAVVGGKWSNEEDAEILMVERHKIFWDYARAIGNPATEIALRRYIIASFLLTYDPSYAMITTAFDSPIAFRVEPETGVVPMNPRTTASNVAGYRRSSGVYMREFANCYFRGVRVNRCAVVVNPGGGTVSVPSGYSHSMTLAGGSILDGGKIGFSGPAVRSLGPADGAVLFP